MRIGFASMFSWRPHAEHTYWLSLLAREAGHEASYLTCDGDLSACYPKVMRPQRRDWVHCARCRVGGLRSFASRGVVSIGELDAVPVAASPETVEWSRSSASTIGRFETDEDYASEEFALLARQLDEPTRLAHAAALRWIERERLDAVCVFNGRMDATRALIEAARSSGISFATVDRTWFGDGLHLLPQENVLGLRSIDHMMRLWRDVPLSRDQALRAAAHVAARFLRRNQREWRAYNMNAFATEWPVAGARRRILLVPGSRNEFWGHPDWASCWSEPTDAYDALVDRLGLTPSDMVLRCHPNWGERIGPQDGSRSERYFTQWAQRRGIHVISSTDATSTLGLIEQCDAIVINGGSAALEAGILGKQVIAVGPSIYQQAGFQTDAFDEESMSRVSLGVDAPTAALMARRTLRFCHIMAYRVAQFVPYVRCVTTTNYEYREGAEPERLIRMLKTRELQADDTHLARDGSGEEEVLAMIASRDWERLGVPPAWPASVDCGPPRRRWMFRPVDRIREAMLRGDL